MNSVKIPCSQCGGRRNHKIITFYAEEKDPPYSYTHQICQCAGCDVIRFRSICDYPIGFDDDGEEYYEEEIFPEPSLNKRIPLKSLQNNRNFPQKIRAVYLETVAAINHKNRILAAGGLRAMVEATCIDRNIKGRNLEKKSINWKN